MEGVDRAAFDPLIRSGFRRMAESDLFELGGILKYGDLRSGRGIFPGAGLAAETGFRQRTEFAVDRAVDYLASAAFVESVADHAAAAGFQFDPGCGISRDDAVGCACDRFHVFSSAESCGQQYPPKKETLPFLGLKYG